MHTTELGGALMVLLGGWLLVAAALDPKQQPRFAALALFGGALSGVVLPVVGFFAERAQASAWVGAAMQFVGRTSVLLELDRLDVSAALLLTAVGATWLVSAALVPSLGVGSGALIALLNGGVVVPLVWSGFRAEGVRAALSALGASGWWEAVSPLGWSGLIAGASLLGWLVRIPREETPQQPPRLPAAHVPWQGVAGVLTLLIGLVLQEREASATPRVVGGVLGIMTAVLVAGGYTAFVTRDPDTLSMARAALGSAFFALATPSSTLLAVYVAMGIVNGLLATVGYYVVNERLRLGERHGLLVSVWTSSLLGALLNTLEAVSSSTADFASASLVQAAGFVWGLLPAFGIHAVSASLVHRAQPRHATSTPSLEVEVPTGTAAQEERNAAVEAQTMAAGDAPEREAAMTPPAYAAGVPLQEEAEQTAQPEAAAIPSAQLAAAAPVNSATPASAETLIASEETGRWWQFWRRRRSRKPSTPRRVARKVAYPRRVAGRPLAVHPLAEEEHTPLSDATTEERPTQ